MNHSRSNPSTLHQSFHQRAALPGVLAAVLIFVLSMPTRVSAQEPDAVIEGFKLLRKGNYDEATEKFTSLKEQTAKSYVGRARVLTIQGKYEDSLKLLEEAKAKKPSIDADIEIGEIHIILGKLDEAMKSADAALKQNPDYLPARWLQARVMILQGKLQEANGKLKWFIDYYNDKQPSDVESMLIIARAAAEHARWNKIPEQFDFILKELLGEAAKLEPENWEPLCESGSLLIEKYNEAEGIPDLEKSLQLNPSALPTLISLGDASLQRFDLKQAIRIADEALSINPRHVPAFNLKVDATVLDSRASEAEAIAQKALAVNPQHEGALGRLVAVHRLNGKQKEAEKIEQEVLKRNPKPHEFYFRAGDLLENRRQFDVAEYYIRKAVETGPHLAAPLNSLGMLLMRIGKEDEARTVIAKARELDPFHIRVKNFSLVLEELSKYKVIESPHYQVLVKTPDDEMLGEYMSEYLESRHAELCKMFGYEPKEKSRIEIMSSHRWFSARVVGLPSIGTVGACTGRVVALASPRAIPQPFHWGRVLTHEVTHVITLQQTKFNIPHWYTEALAVLSEGFARPQIWNQLLAERVPKKDLLNLDTINQAFVRPKTQLDWQMAYCQSLLYAQYMLKRFGNDSLAKMLSAYEAGLETEPAIKRSFNVSKEDFEKGYLEYLNEVVKSINVIGPATKRSFVEVEAAVKKKPDDPDLLAELAQQHVQRRGFAKAREYATKAIEKNPKHPIANFVLAKMEFTIGKEKEALAMLEPVVDSAKPNPDVIDLLAAIRMKQKDYSKAAELYQMLSKADPLNQKWQEGLARVYLIDKQTQKLPPILKSIAHLDADNISVRQKLAELSLEAKDYAEASKWAYEALYIDVSDGKSHAILGEAKLALKDSTRAIREFENAIKLKAKYPNLKAKLAEALATNGRKDDAMKILQEILTGNANDAEAKRIKKQFFDQ